MLYISKVLMNSSPKSKLGIPLFYTNLRDGLIYTALVCGGRCHTQNLLASPRKTVDISEVLMSSCPKSKLQIPPPPYFTLILGMVWYLERSE